MNVYIDDQDDTDVLILKETLSKVDDLTKKIQSSLSSISKGSLYAERAIRPISGKTKMLALYGKNLGSSLTVIEDIRDYARLTAECETTLNSGIAKVGLTNYTDALGKLKKAHDELSASQLRTFYKVVDKTEQLIKSGNSGIKDYFRSLLAEAYKPINVGDLIQRGLQMPRLSGDQVRAIRELFAYFNSAHVKVDDIFLDIVSRFFSSSLSPLSKSIKLTPQSKKTPVDGLRTYASASIEMCLGINDDLNALSNGNSEGQMTYYKEELCRSTAVDFETTISSLADQVGRSTQTDAAAVFELVDWTNAVQRAMTSILRKPPSRLVQLSQKLTTNAMQVLIEMLKYIETRVQQLTTLPSDNGVSDATIDVMSKLSKLADHKVSAMVILKGATYGSWLPAAKPAWATMMPQVPSTSEDPIELLSGYFADALDDLFLNLEIKAKVLGKKNNQIGFLLLMNLTMVEHYAKKSDVAGIMGSTGGERIERLRKRGMNLFLEGWKTIAAHLMDVTVVRPGNKQLSSKDREAVKEKFKTFNAEFDQLVQRHKSYNITDPHLRQQLAKEIAFIQPLYHRFYDKHCGGDFTKNIDKYIKYNKEQFDEVLRTLA